MEFHFLSLSDRDELNTAFKRDGRRMCESSFALNYLWRDVYRADLARYGNFFVFRYSHEPFGECYSFPFGDRGNDAALKDLIGLLEEDAKSRNNPLIISPMLKEDTEKLDALFPGKFNYTADRDMADYLYSREKLATLSGRKLHSKRNHIARFTEDGDWNYEEINESNLCECLALENTWLDRKGHKYNDAVIEETSAVSYALNRLDKLGLTGGLLRKAGRVVAFAIGEPLTNDTYVIHIEKALAEVQGSYATINKEFVLRNCEGFTYVNREDDAGDEGLRRAKLSYYPEIILEKYTAQSL